MLEKIAAADLDHLLIKSAHVIRTLEEENADLKRQLAHKERYDHAEKIAHMAVSRGLMGEDAADDYAEVLASSERDLGMVEEFMSRSSGVGIPLGEDFNKTASDHDLPDGDSAEDRFASFLLTSDIQ